MFYSGSPPPASTVGSAAGHHPKKANLTYYRTSAAAQEARFRACKALPSRRCAWVAGMECAPRLGRPRDAPSIADGAIDRDGVGGLAATVGVQRGQLNRQLMSELGGRWPWPGRSERGRLASCWRRRRSPSVRWRSLRVSSIRQFNDTIRQIFAATPTQLRNQASESSRAQVKHWARRFDHGSTCLSQSDERSGGTGFSRQSRRRRYRGVHQRHVRTGHWSCLMVRASRRCRFPKITRARRRMATLFVNCGLTTFAI